MKESKHKIVIGCEVLLLCMMIGVLGTKAASSNPPSNGVSYNKNSQTTVEGALNDLYDKANYGNASAGSILSGHTALVGGNKVTGTMSDRTNNTGTLGLAWSTSDYQMMGDQLRIGVSPGYYGTNNYWTWGTSGIVFDKYQEKLGITADKIVKGQSIAGVNGTASTGYSSCSSCCPSCPSGTLYKYLWFNKIGTSTLNYSSANGAKELTFSIDLGSSYSNVQLAYAIVSLENSTSYFEIYDGRASNDFVAFSDRNWTNEMASLINESLNPNRTSVSVSGSTLTVKMAHTSGIHFRKLSGSFSSNESITYRIKGAIYYQV